MEVMTETVAMPTFDIYVVVTKEGDGDTQFFGAWTNLEDARREANRRYNGFIIRFGLDLGPDDYGWVE